jgi:hypothetical protein
MKYLVIALAWPLMGGAAFAAQPLSDPQLDSVAGGFAAVSIADAEGLVGESGILYNAAASLSQVSPYASATFGETTLSLMKSVAAAQSSSVQATFSPSSVVTP